MPHLMIGFGNEFRGIDKLHEYGETEVCFIILSKHPQIKNDLKEPKLDEIENILKYARPLFKKIHLGCMRPINRKKDIDKMAVKYVDSIVNPHKSLDLKKFKIDKKFECCSF